MPTPRSTALLAILFAVLLLAGRGHAATFQVNNFNDLNDTNPGDGVCNVGDGTCSLRAAVQEANALAGADTIVLGAGTHHITQIGQFEGVPISMRGPLQIIGAGAESSIVLAQDSRFISMLEIPFENSGSVSLSHFTLDARSTQSALYDTTLSCPGCQLVLESMVIDGTITQPAAFISLLRLEGVLSSQLRDVRIEASGGAGGSLHAIYSTGGAALLIEDSLIDGGGSASMGLLYLLRNASSALQVRRSRFANVASVNTGSAAIRLLNINGGSGPEVQVEDSRFETVPRGVLLNNYGFAQDVRIERSLFASASAAGIELAGPGSGLVRNSTVSAAATGVALSAPNSGTGTFALALDSLTIAGGTTSVAVGSGLGTVSARNSILAGASSAACTGTLDSLGHLLVQGSCSLEGDTTGNLIGVDPLLAPLAENGGPSRTHALLAASPAIDSGDVDNCPAVDQRGFPRPADGDGDTQARCDRGAFELGAPPPNQAPIAEDDAVSTDRNTPLQIAAATLLANDSDPDGDALAISADAGATAEGGSYDCGLAGCDYQPPVEFVGEDSFGYEVCDDGSPVLCDQAQVVVTVLAVNRPPQTQDDAVSTDRDTPLQIAAATLLANDTDPDGDVLTLSAGAGASDEGGSYDCDVAGCDYQPPAEFVGGDAFPYEACDDGEPVLCDQALVVVTVLAVNQPPVAQDDAISALEDTLRIIEPQELLTNDVDPDGDTLAIFDGAGLTLTGATYTCDASGCSYQPGANYHGEDFFPYMACDGGAPLLCDGAFVIITIQPVNDPPSFLPGPAQVFEAGSAGAQAVAGWASDIDLGPNEAEQAVLGFEITLLEDPQGVVVGMPIIDVAGNLGFELSGAAGLARFQVVLRDDGGVEFGGIDVSSPQPLHIAVDNAADLAVTIKQCSAKAVPGDLYPFALRVGNSGPGTGLDLLLLAPWPAGSSIEFIGNDDCVDAGSGLACHVHLLDSGAHFTVPLQLRLPNDDGALLTLQASVSSASADPVASNDVAEASVLLDPALVLDDSFESCDGGAGPTSGR